MDPAQLVVGSPRLDLPVQAACELRAGGGPHGSRWARPQPSDGQGSGWAPAASRACRTCRPGHGGPLWVLTLPALPPTVSTKDLIETCCAAGQQWAIDNDECLDIPESGAEDDVCR